MGAENGKESPQNFTDLRKQSKYTITELKEWHETFTQTHPHGYLTMADFDELYCQQFPNGISFRCPIYHRVNLERC